MKIVRWVNWYDPKRNDFIDIIMFTHIKWAKLLPWPQCWITLLRVNKTLVWSFWYDHIYMTILIWPYDMIILIWSYWYDHIDIIILISSYWYHHIDMIIFTYINWAELLPWPQSWMTLWRVNMNLVWSFWYDHVDMIILIWSYLLI